LVGAQSSACGSLMLHRTESSGGVERMVMVPKVKVPAHGSVTFAPGGYHLMCMKPAAALMVQGHLVSVTLKFGNGETLSADFPVRNAAGK
ncbi:MAG: copper chaperone PCu(A)C, partial [Stellaceae bacterium]